MKKKQAKENRNNREGRGFSGVNTLRNGDDQKKSKIFVP